MATTLAQPETVLRAVIEKAPAAPPPPGSSQEAAGILRKKMAEQGPKSALEAMRARSKPPGETARKVSEINEKNIGFEKDATGRTIRGTGTEEARRLDTAKNYTGLTKDFLEKGFDGLSSSQKIAARSMVDNALNAFPEMEAFLSTMSPGEVNAVLDTLLKNPEYAASLSRVFEKAAEPSKALASEAVSDLKTKFDEESQKEKAKTDEISKNSREASKINTELDQFAKKGGISSTKLKELEDLTRDMPDIQRNLADAQERFDEAKETIRDVDQRRRVQLGRGVDDTTVQDAEITARRKEARIFQREIIGYQDKIQRKASLEQEKASLEQEKQKLEENRVKLEDELKIQTKARIAAQADYATAKMDRASQEDDYVDGLRGMFGEATFQYLEDKIEKAETAQKELLQQEEANAEDPAEKAILSKIQTRWEKVEGGYNKEKIDSDYKSVLSSNGAIEVLREMLITSGFSLDEANVKLADKAFVEKMQPKVVEKLLTRKLQTGKPTEQEARLIIESEWGKGMIDKAIANKKELKDAVNTLMAEGVVKDNKGLLKLLLLLFGGLITLGILPTTMLLKDS
ncbi:MAG: hypothetical protein Q7S38_01815 [bacterium]|nr:hypothetical protein [bacterium]